MAFRALFDAMMEMEVIFRSGSSFSGFSVSKEVFLSLFVCFACIFLIFFLGRKKVGRNF